MEDNATYIGKYEVLGILGRGGMGVVYKGHDPHIDRTVAIKTVRLGLYGEDEEAELLARFKREAQAVGRLSHPNIVQVFEYSEQDGRPYIAMEFMQGRELADLVAESGRFEAARAVRVIDQVLSALAYCHAQGVVHRDLKPANILVQDDDTLKVMDFGIARLESSKLTRTGAVMGTPSYMSPEQLTGEEADARSDLFQAAVVLYELLTGRTPFPGKTVPAIITRVLRSEFDPPTTCDPDLAPDWDRVLARALATDPGHRFQDAGAFRDAVRLAAEGRYEDDFAVSQDAETLLAVQRDAPTRVRPATEPARAPVTGGEPTSLHVSSAVPVEPSDTAPPDEAPRPRAARARVAIALAAVVGLVTAGGAMWWIGRSGAPASSPEPVAAATAPAPETTPEPSAPAPETTPEPSAPAPQTTPEPPAPAEGVLEVESGVLEGSYYGQVRATSEPSGATVLIDDVPFGETPFEVEVPPGEYQMRIEKDGFAALETRLSMDPGTLIDVRARLRAR